MTKHALFYLLALIVLALTACAQGTGEPAPTSAVETPVSESSPGPSPGDQVGDIVKIATDALASVLGIDAADITMTSIERLEFPDAALGCAQPGEVAAAVATPGYKVFLDAGGVLYELRTNLDGTIVRCLPAGAPVVQAETPVPEMPDAAPPTSTPLPTPDDGIDKTVLDTVEAALETKDYDRLQATLPNAFWLGFYASEAGKMSPEEVLDKLQALYLGPGLVRVYRDVDVFKLLPDWASAAPYARLVYSTGWGEGQKDDAILLFEEQASALNWAGMFYIFDGLKTTAYGAGAAGLPAPPAISLKAFKDAIEAKDYAIIQSLVTDPFVLLLYDSEPTQLSADALVEALQRNYLEPGEVQVRFDVDVKSLLPDWTPDPACAELLYSTGWGQDQADDGVLCLKDEAGALRWNGLLYIAEDLQESAYAETPPEGEADDIEGMIYIPAGTFIMGSNEGEISALRGACAEAGPSCDAGQFEDEAPQRKVTLEAFYIDKTEVTLAQFKEFVAATGFQTASEVKGDPVQYTWRAFDAPDRQDHPVRWMSWHDAAAYCHWAGKRLPTEAEWERAARGTEGLVYPWGNGWDDARVPHGDTAPVTTFSDGASPDGVLGMAGGVWEWVADWYDSLYYQYGPTTNPIGPEQTIDKVLRGGAFGNQAYQLRAAHRHYGGAAGYAHDHGFRCARDADE